MPRHLTISLLLACAPLLPAKSHVAERYDVRVTIESDATLRVAESVHFQFRGGSFSYVSRDIRKAGTDRIFGIQCTMDGQPARADVHENRDAKGRSEGRFLHDDMRSAHHHEYALSGADSLDDKRNHMAVPMIAGALRDLVQGGIASYTRRRVVTAL